MFYYRIVKICRNIFFVYIVECAMRTVAVFWHDFLVIRLLFNAFKYSSFLDNAQNGFDANTNKKAKPEKIIRNVNISLITHATSPGFSRRGGSDDDIR